MTTTARRCTKKRYRTQNEALVALVSCRFRKAVLGRQRRKEQRAYACPWCRGWHLTSQEQKGAA